MNSRAFVFCALAFLLSSIPAKAQKITIGAITGANLSGYSWVGNTPNYEKDWHGHMISYNINLSARYRFNDEWSINLQPGFIIRGIKYFEERMEHKYVQLPILMEYQWTDKLSVFGGLEIAYLLNERDLPEFQRPPGGYLGVQLGLNYKLNELMDLGFGYSRSLNAVKSVLRTSASGQARDYASYNQNFQLKLRFNLVSR